MNEPTLEDSLRPLFTEGQRVGVILSFDEKTLKFFGYGVYAGKELPKDAAGVAAEYSVMAGIKEDKLVLDDGQVLYASECWFDHEVAVQARLKLLNDEGGLVEKVAIKDIREAARANMSGA